MKYFIDTEFSERGPDYRIELISIGIVAEDGRELYACNQSFKPKHANAWVKANVLPLLPPKPKGDAGQFPSTALAWMPLDDLRNAIFTFVNGDLDAEFWGYYSDFDWVVFSQLFGGMGDLPTGWPMRCNDLRQYLDHEGFDHISQPEDAPHNALQDARWVRDTYITHSHGRKAAE